MKKNTRTTQSIPRAQSRMAGFTILETLVAIAILIVAITGPLAIVAQALRASYFSRDQITAYYLAQEAIEYIRNTRDTLGAGQGSNGADWLSTLVDENGAQVAINTVGSDQNKLYLVRAGGLYQLMRCDTGLECPPVTLNTNVSDEALYGEDTITDDSIFIREIILTKPVVGISSDGYSVETDAQAELRELVVVVNVKWRMQNGQYSSGVTLREHLTNWQLAQ
ncbi:MAG: hypothetical protein QG568_784 [Patescibacteria group bacterium]|nr:hypothetical protein [Patescibacteria group bacterium]